MKNILQATWKFLKKRGVFSFLALVGIIYIYYAQIRKQERWKHKNIIESDAIWYYEYLPLAFVKKDLKMSFLDDADPGPGVGKFWFHKAPNGARVSKVTYGMSLLYSPFFFGAYYYSQWKGQDIAFGYSYTFQRFLYLSGIFYFCLGMFFLWLILKKFFPDLVSALVLTLIALATNLVYYVQDEGVLAHAPGFALMNIGLYLTMRMHQKPNVWNAIFFGLVFGIMVLVRPVNILFCLVPLFYGIKTLKDLRWKAAFIRENYYMVIIIFLMGVLVYLPQLIYWKNITGSWFYYSYDGERFFFSKPAILQVLVSFRKGWYIYTPIMFFATLGIFTLGKNMPAWKWALALFIAINIFIVSSWWCWWYGGGFGMRALVDMYGIMALCLASFIWFLWNKSKWFVIPILLISAGAIMLNQYQIIQYRRSQIHWDGMTWNAYRAIFATKKIPNDNWYTYEYVYLDPLTPEDYDAAKKGERFW